MQRLNSGVDQKDAQDLCRLLYRLWFHMVPINYTIKSLYHSLPVVGGLYGQSHCVCGSCSPNQNQLVADQAPHVYTWLTFVFQTLVFAKLFLHARASGLNEPRAPLVCHFRSEPVAFIRPM